MTIKQKMNIRIERIKDYMEQVSYCRDMRRCVNAMSKDITKFVDADRVDETYACIKIYYTQSPATSVNEVGDGVYQHMKLCHRFNENPCPIFNCPYNEQNKQFKNNDLLLRQAQIDKQAAFKRIFSRIK